MSMTKADMNQCEMTEHAMAGHGAMAGHTTARLSGSMPPGKPVGGMAHDMSDRAMAAGGVSGQHPARNRVKARPVTFDQYGFPCCGMITVEVA
jgi:hypothetical protein